MNRLKRSPMTLLRCAALIAIVGIGTNAFAQHDAEFAPPDDVAFRAASIISEGTRMSAEVFSPQDAKYKLPTIIMSHG